MPNWCYNNVDITAKTEEGKALLYRVSTAEAADGFFELLRPLGEWDYNRSVENWGTKWDVEPTDVDFDGETMSTSFDSAWSPPIELYAYLKEQGFEVTANYYEPGMDFGGFWNDGEETVLEDVSDIARTDEDEWDEDFRELDNIYGIAEDIAMWDEDEEDEE
jgi:hypothetical protein